MAKTFIAGTDAESALPNLEKLWKSGIAFSVDLLGEACVSDAEADMYQAKYLDLVGNLPDTVAGWKSNERLETDHLGVVPGQRVVAEHLADGGNFAAVADRRGGRVRVDVVDPGALQALDRLAHAPHRALAARAARHGCDGRAALT